MIRILHVVDRDSGGVPEAVETFATTTQDIAHHVLISTGQNLKSKKDDPFSKRIDLGSGTLTRIRRVRAAARDIGADVVHAHSSFSGVYARASLRKQAARVVYSPHCFAHERLDISEIRRTGFRAIEKLLSRRTDVYAACSHHETEDARAFGEGRADHIFVPNISRHVKRGDARKFDSGELVVSGLGRIGPQKNPLRFLEVVRGLQSRGIPTKAFWLGDGDPDLRSKLEAGEVEVTGWLSEAQLSEMLERSHVYVHSASWEGFPIAVLDAHAAGCAILVDPITAFGEVPPVADTSEFLRSVPLHTTAQADAWYSCNRAHWENALAGNTPADQAHQLALAWGTVPSGAQPDDTSTALPSG